MAVTVRSETRGSWIKVATYSGRAFWEVAFKSGEREIKRRIGVAWLVPAGNANAKANGKTYRAGKWVERQGRPKGDALTYDTARERVPAILADFAAAKVSAVAEAEALRVEVERPRTFRELAHDWREYLDRKGTKPSTLVGYDAMLSEPGTPYRRGRGQTCGYIMAALGSMPANDVSVGDVEQLLTTIAETSATPRTVEKHRIMVRSILNFGIRETKRARAGSGSSHGHDYGLTVNAAQVAEGPRQKARDALIYYLPEEVEALARALEGGYQRHSKPRHQPECATNAGAECDCTPSYRIGRLKFEDHDSAARYLRTSRDDAQILSDLQDAVAVRISAYTGLRLGELLALRWSDVDWAGFALTISRAVSAGKETTPKPGKVRRVPLPEQAMFALERLSHRADFTEPSQLVFCNVVTGRPLDGSALRRRYKEAQSVAGVHAMRWHDLRHTYGSLLAASGEELVTIKSAMGHANISTTEVYLHARPATELAKRFTTAFTTTASATLPDGHSAQAQ
jgi:integrase